MAGSPGRAHCAAFSEVTMTAEGVGVGAAEDGAGADDEETDFTDPRKHKG